MAEMTASTDERRQNPTALADRLRGVIGRLEAEALQRVAKRHTLEKRWIQDLEQYHGKYDTETQAALDQGESSKLFINLTRPKTNAMAARLMDLLFPTDDKNWGIGPTPVPELDERAKAAALQAEQAQSQADQAAAAAQEPGAPPEAMAQAQAAQQNADVVKAAADELEAIVMEAKRRADLMSAEIDDQLKESDYHAVMRDVIEDACKLGTGVCKGPITGDAVRKGWRKGDDGQYVLQMSDGAQHPAMRYVDIWNFFPDMDARTIKESQGEFERHLLNKKGLRKLARLPGYDRDAIRRLLQLSPQSSAPSYLADLRNIKAENQHITGDLYHVWEYSGPLDAEDLRDIATAIGDDDMLRDVEEIDELQEINVILWFCQGEVLKLAPYPLDSGETLYSVFCLEKNESSIFGDGIPTIMRDPQRALNASWRAMMDNAGLASGPQIVIAREMVTPADGDWRPKPRKIWFSNAAMPHDRRAFDVFVTPMHQPELAGLIALAERFIDDMTGMPKIAQGEQGTGITRTAQGMALLMNSANVVFRRIVKAFDDDMTVPNIRRFYDWNMQFSPKEEIKGDYQVDARGSSVLLVREMQAQNLMLIALQLGAHPVYGPMLKNRNVLKLLFRAHMIPSDEVMLTDDEIDAVLAQSAAEREANDMEMRKLEAQIAIAEMEWGAKRDLAELERETALIKMAETMNMSLDKLEAMMADRREERQSKERMFAAEAAIETRRIAQAREAGMAEKRSGGYF